MPKRWCSSQPCNELITAPATRCATHQAAADQAAAQRRTQATRGRPNTTARGYGSIYQRRQAQIVAAAIEGHHPCHICGEPCLPGQRIVAHHPDGNPAAADPATCRLEPAHKHCNDGYRA